MLRFLPTLACLLLASCGLGHGPTMEGAVPRPAGLSFLPDRAEKGDLFAIYQPGLPSKWRGNWTSQFDFSGISFNDARTATLIAPSFVVMAKHFQRPSNVPVMFHNKRGRSYKRLIVSQRNLSVGDISVAKLNEPLPPDVKPFPFADASDATAARPVLVTDQHETVFVHRIAAVAGGTIGLDWIPGLNPVYRKKLIVGDSGNPSFIAKNGRLFLLETHTSGGPGAGPFYGEPQIQGAIRAAMEKMN